MEPCGKFVIRVYGLILNEHQELLVSDEFQLDQRMTKFPGGGLDFGEGPVDCLVREIMEECNGQKIKNIEHFYTTGFYQKALFYPDHQLISIYYRAELDGEPVFSITDRPFAFDEDVNGNQSFRWVSIQNINPEEFSFPIDQYVVRKLKSSWLEKK